MTGINTAPYNQRPVGRGRRTKQISHESTSSFFSTATAVSLSSGGGEAQRFHAHPILLRRTASMPGQLQSTREGEQPQVETPKMVVQRFLHLCQQGEMGAAAHLLDPAVQVSYPGQAYIKSAADWQRTARGMDPYYYAWQVLQQGAHANQVVRRGCVRSRPHETVIEVFELHETTTAQQQQGGGGSSNNGTIMVIGAMYLRRAPRQWTIFGNPGLRSSNHKKNKKALTDGRLSVPSQRLQRDMLQGDILEEGNYCSNESSEEHE